MSKVEEGMNDGVLFCIENGKHHVRQTQVGLSNGLAWTQDCKTMYYIDSLRRTVDVMNVEPAGGQICTYSGLHGSARAECWFCHRVLL